MLLNRALFALPPSEVKQHGWANLTYGSLTTKGLQTLSGKITKWMAAEAVNGFDLGCGDGELIYHMGRLLPGSNWEGVEISEHRVALQSKDVCIWQGDMLEENYRPYNVLHADNLCLDEPVAARLEEKIALEFKGLYITYRRPEHLGFLKRAHYLETVPTETTWTTHPIHLYYLA
jgi:hypothetical protein